MMTLNQAIEGFVISLRANGYSCNTIELYKWGLGNLVSQLGNKQIKDISAHDPQEFMLHLQEAPKQSGNGSPLSPASIENIWVAGQPHVRES